MPILKIDSMGRIYQTSRDSENGSGYGGHAVPVSQGDVTLGASYIKANHALQESILRDVQVRKLEDQRFEAQKRAARAKAAAERVRSMNEAKLRDNRVYQEHLVRKAASMGCECPFQDKLSGHGLTANGQRGFAGMTRDQQAIHRHLSGMGVDSSYMIDKREVQARSAHQNNLNAATRRLMAEENKKRILSKRG